MILKAQKEVYYKLLEAYKSKQLPLKELEESAARIRQIEIKESPKICGGRTRRRTSRCQPGGKNLP